MDKKKKEQLILLILVIFLVAMLPRMIFKKRPQGAAFQEPFMQDTAGIAVQQPADLPQRPEPSASTAGPSVETVDPFDVPAALQEKFVVLEGQELEKKESIEQEKGLAGINILGVVWGGNTPIAFIDDKVYKIGDMVADAQILDIKKEGVYFLSHEKKVLIGLKAKEEKADKRQVQQEERQW